MARTVSLDKFGDVLRKIGKSAAKRAVTATINDAAFATRDNALEEIGSQMTIRAQRFVGGSIRVAKARHSRQEATVGSIVRDRFSGWEEQETGSKSDKDRAPTLAARGGNKKKRMAPSVRFKAANKFPEQDDFSGNTVARRIVDMLRVLERRKYRKPFLISKKRRGFRRGLYRFRRKKLELVQALDTPQKVRKNPWMKPAYTLTLNSGRVLKKWKEEMGRALLRRR